MPLPEKDFFSIGEIAHRWKCDVETVLHYVATSKLRAGIFVSGAPAYACALTELVNGAFDDSLASKDSYDVFAAFEVIGVCRISGFFHMPYAQAQQVLSLYPPPKPCGLEEIEYLLNDSHEGVEIQPLGPTINRETALPPHFVWRRGCEWMDYRVDMDEKAAGFQIIKINDAPPLLISKDDFVISRHDRNEFENEYALFVQQGESIASTGIATQERRELVLLGWLYGRDIVNGELEMTREQVWDALGKADKRLFPPVSPETVSAFFKAQSYCTFKKGRRKGV